jgi:hypothetical protein
MSAFATKSSVSDWLFEYAGSVVIVQSTGVYVELLVEYGQVRVTQVLQV